MNQSPKRRRAKSEARIALALDFIVNTGAASDSSAGLYFQNCETSGNVSMTRVLQLAVHALDLPDVDVLDRVAVLVELHRPARRDR